MSIENKNDNFANPLVMRCASEIELRLSQAEEGAKQHAGWIVTAQSRYDNDRCNWGEADYGEVRTARDAHNDCFREAQLLKWVLGHIA